MAAVPKRVSGGGAMPIARGTLNALIPIMEAGQNEATSEQWGMPEAAVRTGAVDYVLPLEAIGPAIDAIVDGRPVAGVAAGA